MSERRPNFLVFMTDQQRGDCLGLERHPVLLTPSMDEIGWRGAHFARAYSTCPVSIPARRSFLSGQFPSTHGVVGYQDTDWDGPTIASELAKSGYQTAWLGRSMHQDPPSKHYGFEEVVDSDHRLQPDSYGSWLGGRQARGAGGHFGAGIMHNDWTARSWHMDDSLHPSHWVANEALAFLGRRDKSRPFFMVASFAAPHPPLIPPAFYFDRYVRTGVPAPAIGDWATPPPNDGIGLGPSPQTVNLKGEALLSTRAAYYGLINHVDDQIHRLLSEVLGVQAMTGNNTVIIFCADHGEMLGDHYMWRKSRPYEPAARIPFMIRAPGWMGLPGGLRIEKPVGLEDIMPTVLEMAGAPLPPNIDGRSLLPLLRGQDAPWREYIQIECAPTFQCLTDGREKYIWMVADGREQFFNLVDDPTECHDLSREAAWAARIAEWRTRMIAQLANRPEGFSDGKRLIPGRPYPAIQKKA